jgi:hypothetical protein
MTGCDVFKEITLNSCPDNFIITAGLTASTLYGWELKNKFNRKIIGELETDADGVLTIPVTDPLSKDMFHDFSNAYEFRLYTIGESDEHIPLQFCSMFDYLVLIFEDVQPVPDPNNALITLDC